MNILTNADARIIGALVAAGSSIDNDSSIIDMQDYERAVFLCPIEDSVATGVATLTIESDDASGGGTMAAITGAVASKACAVNDDLNSKMLVVEVAKPAKRYLRANRASATANIAYGPLIVLLFGPRKAPVTLDSTVLDYAIVNDAVAVA